MGVADRKEREKEEMRIRILEAAKKLFLEKGFEKTSIRNIADLIEYSPGTIYLYFKDKNDLLYNLHSEAFRELIKVLALIDFSKPPIQQLEEMGDLYINFAFENPELYELMFVMDAPMESLECKDEVWDDGKQAFSILTTLVTECQKDGYLSAYDTEDASLMVWSFVHGLVILKSRKRLSFFFETDEENLQRMIRSYHIFINQIKCGKV
jgi:AcrR family transcriptional regulator